MRKTLLALCLLAAALPAAAQVYFGAEVGPDAFLKQESAKPDVSGEDAFSWAFSAEVSSASLYAVFESTVPEHEIFRYLRDGMYRQELAAVFLLSEKTSVPFKKLAGELAKDGSFAALAARHKADAMALFEAGARLKEAVDLRVPLFLSVSVSTAAYEEPLSTAAAAAPKQDEKK
jgi:hypothetical protein